MSLFETLQKDLSIIAADASGPAVDVVFTDKNGLTTTLRGFFSAPTADVTPAGQTVPFAANVPTLRLPVQPVLSLLGRKLAKNDELVINGVRYTPRRCMQNDAGYFEIPLQEV